MINRLFPSSDETILDKIEHKKKNRKKILRIAREKGAMKVFVGQCCIDLGVMKESQIKDLTADVQDVLEFLEDLVA